MPASRASTPPAASAPLVVCYHDSCPDGGCAAAIVRGVVPDAELVPVRYHAPLPELAGRDVQFVDFCPTVDELVYLATQARSLEVIDHHVSADDRLREAAAHPAVQAAQAADPARFTYTFDPQYSGAMLAWRRYHGVTPPPPLVAYVQDRDLWKHELPDTQAINYGVFLTGMDPDSMAGLLTEDLAAIRERGAARLAEIAERLAYYGPRTEQVDFAGHRVPAVVLHPAESYLRSDLGSHLNQPDADGRRAPFAVIAIPGPDGVKISLRGRKGAGEVDLQVLAQQFGGGGHVDAASCHLSEMPWVSQHAPPVPPSASAPWADVATASAAGAIQGAARGTPASPAAPPSLPQPTGGVSRSLVTGP